jgi:hypothetical protein
MGLRRWLTAGSAVTFFALLSAPACSSNTSTGGPPVVPCNGATAHAQLCGQACHNKCGCTACNDGDTLTLNGDDYVCSGNCFLLGNSATGGTGGGGTGGAAGAGGSAGGGNCTTIDCNADPPICGAGCTSCACCSCNDGDQTAIGGNPYVCASGCFTPLFDAGTDGG